MAGASSMVTVLAGAWGDPSRGFEDFVEVDFPPFFLSLDGVLRPGDFDGVLRPGDFDGVLRSGDFDDVLRSGDFDGVLRPEDFPLNDLFFSDCNHYIIYI